MVNNNGLKPWYSQSETLLVAEDLRKTYGARVALRKLSFTLQAGHVMGFLGPEWCRENDVDPCLDDDARAHVGKLRGRRHQFREP